MDTFPDLIETLGGAAVVARAVKQDPGTARQWKARNRIPPAYWPGIVALAKSKKIGGVTMEKLATLATAVDRERVEKAAA